jgi:hypothetical protein
MDPDLAYALRGPRVIPFPGRRPANVVPLWTEGEARLMAARAVLRTADHQTDDALRLACRELLTFGDGRDAEVARLMLQAIDRRTPAPRPALFTATPAQAAHIRRARRHTRFQIVCLTLTALILAAIILGDAPARIAQTVIAAQAEQR